MIKDKQLKILYLMHVPWGWIKQRPHFIAEQLEMICDVVVCFRKRYRKEKLVHHEATSTLAKIALFALPLSSLSIIEKINVYLIKLQLKAHLRKTDIVWVTFPVWFPSLEEKLIENKMVIYDCMDDVLEFLEIRSKEEVRNGMRASEQALVNRADLIFVSSGKLKQVLLSRYRISCPIHVVNNAIQLTDFDEKLLKQLPRHIEEILSDIKLKKMMYIGTISEWIDTRLILESLERQPEIVYIFVGPLDTTLPNHDRLFVFSPVPHHYVYGLMHMADALIMPFKVNDLIRSVNPVKLYEYIYACKPVVSVEYEETLRFSDFIYTYRNAEGYHFLIEQIVNNKLIMKKSRDECIGYVKENNWAARARVITEAISRYEHDKKTASCSDSKLTQKQNCI